MSEVFINIDGVSAGYGKTKVLRDISLQVKRGETYGLIGLNGAGKTTLLKILLGLKDAKSGSVLIDGEPAGSTQAKKRLAYLPERFDPAWFLNAYEFIDFTTSLYGQKVRRADVDAMALKLGLNVSYLSKLARTYSKGMRQKLGLMATFLTSCPLMILDEPMSGLDPRARAQVKNLMIEASEQGRTIFLSSHILSDLEELCGNIAVLHDGNLVFVGSPDGLLNQTGEPYLEKAFLKAIEVPENGQKAA
jgi:ABC-2 type transport system ATP-binding protein